MRKLALVRHSEPDIERDKPASAWRLGEVGRRRAEMLAARLRGFSPAVIWCSKEPKAVETAEIVASAFGVPVRTAEGLEEHHRGGVPYFPTKAEFEGAVEQLFCYMDSIVVSHGTVMTLYAASVAGVRRMCSWRRLGMPSFVVLTLPGMQIRSTVESVIA